MCDLGVNVSKRTGPKFGPGRGIVGTGSRSIHMCRYAGANAVGAQADVLVCSRGGGGLLKERMALLGVLWEAGIRAEMVPEVNPSAQEQYEYAHIRRIPFMATLAAATYSAADTIKVRLPPPPPRGSFSCLKLCRETCNLVMYHFLFRCCCCCCNWGCVCVCVCVCARARARVCVCFFQREGYWYVVW
jgi:Anticodon binding domain